MSIDLPEPRRDIEFYFGSGWNFRWANRSQGEAQAAQSNIRTAKESGAHIVVTVSTAYGEYTFSYLDLAAVKVTPAQPAYK